MSRFSCNEVKPTSRRRSSPTVVIRSCKECDSRSSAGTTRVSPAVVNSRLERQLDAPRAAGCRRIFAEKQSGRDTDRPELTACLCPPVDTWA